MPDRVAVASWLIALMLGFSLAGFADSAYLTAKHYTGGPVQQYVLGSVPAKRIAVYRTGETLSEGSKLIHEVWAARIRFPSPTAR